MYKKLFGTDGIRGKVPEDLNYELACKLGRAVAHAFSHEPVKTRIIIGMDTRESGTMLENALVEGICQRGADAVCAGVVSTPFVSFMLEKENFAAGIMISASHNPPEYNGLKVFAGNGYKISDELEAKLEELIAEDRYPEAVKKGKRINGKKYLDDYILFIKKMLPPFSTGFKAVVDCANGSVSHYIKKIFDKEKNFIYINNKPSGNNINVKCGATDVAGLSEKVTETKSDFGIAFDGDADRMYFVDENGELINGDKQLYLFAKFLKDKEKLSENKIVCTVMSNLGLIKILKENGIEPVVCQVGDKYVSENLILHLANLGGEQSGHLIFKDKLPTVDGAITAAQFINAVEEYGLPVSKYFKDFKNFPQILKNFKVPENMKKKIMENKELLELVSSVNKKLGDRGRVLVRPSGTEPLIRVMLEGEEQSEIEEYMNQFEKLIQKINN